MDLVSKEWLTEGVVLVFGSIVATNIDTSALIDLIRATSEIAQSDDSPRSLRRLIADQQSRQISCG